MDDLSARRSEPGSVSIEQQSEPESISIKEKREWPVRVKEQSGRFIRVKEQIRTVHQSQKAEQKMIRPRQPCCSCGSADSSCCGSPLRGVPILMPPDVPAARRATGACRRTCGTTLPPAAGSAVCCAAPKLVPSPPAAPRLE